MSSDAMTNDAGRNDDRDRRSRSPRVKAEPRAGPPAFLLPAGVTWSDALTEIYRRKAPGKVDKVASYVAERPSATWDWDAFVTTKE